MLITALLLSTSTAKALTFTLAKDGDLTCHNIEVQLSVASSSNTIVDYSWFGPGGWSTVATPTFNQEGWYKLTATDNLSDTHTDSIEITETCVLTPVVLSLTGTNSSCENNGTISASVTGGKAVFEYSLTAGPVCAGMTYPFDIGSDTVFKSLCPGVYTVRVTDSEDQTDEGNYYVDGWYVQPDLFLSKTDPICESSSSGTITANPTDGFGTFTFEMISPSYIDNGTNNEFTGLTSGTYQIRATESCGNFQTRSITLNEPYEKAAIDIYLGQEKKGCDSIQYDIASYGGTNPHMFEIVSPIKTAPQALNQMTLPKTGGPYTLKITDACGDTALFELDYVENIYFQMRNVTCTNFEAFMEDQETFGSNVTWEIISAPGALSPIPAAQPADSNFKDLPFGFYRFQIVNECADTIIKTRTFNAKDPIEADLEEIYGMTCFPEWSRTRVSWNQVPNPISVNIFSAPAAFTANTNIQATGYYAQIDSLPIGSYGVEVEDFCGNKDTIYFSIDTTSYIDVEYTVVPGCGLNDHNIYVDATTNVDPDIEIKYNLYSTEDIWANWTHIDYGSFENLASGTYVLDVYHCNANKYRDTIVLDAYEQPSLDAALSFSCGASTITVTGSASKGNAPYSYEVLDTSLNNVAGPQASAIFTGISAGTPYRLRVTDNCGNTSIKDIIDGASISITYTTSGRDCLGEKFTLSADTIPGVSYSWSGPNGFSSSVSTIKFSSLDASDAGTYALTTYIGACAFKSSSYKITTTSCEAEFLLPVELTSFNVSKYSETILLEWQTETELNNDKFIVQRSYNGVDFTDLSEIQGQGTSYRSNSYDYADNQYEKQTIIYYRLKQIDFDGTYEYSEVQSIRLQESNSDDSQSRISFYPNPIQNQLTVHSTSNSSMTIKIIEPSGRIIRQFSNDHGNEIKLELSDLKTGLYILNIEQNNKVSNETIVKN